MIKNNWNDVIQSSEHSTAYHLCQWSELLEKVHGHKLIYLHNGDSVFPVAYVKSPIFGNRLISLPFADYGGPCASSNAAATELIAQSKALAERLDVDFIEVRSPDAQYHDAFEAHGFVKKDDYLTYILRLDKSINLLWKGIGDKNRNMVRKSQKGDVRIIEATDKKAVKAFYQIYEQTMKKLGSPPQPLSFFERMWDLFHPRNIKVPLAVCNGEYIAAGIYLLHNDIIHHAYSCSMERYLKLAPNNLLQWYMIKWGNEHGYTQFCFGRTRPDAGNVLFKKRWGGDEVSMPYFYKFYKKELDTRQEIRYKQVSRLWARYMPRQLAALIGPWIIRQIG